MLLASLSRCSASQWACWPAVRALSTHVVSAEVAQAVSQHGRGLVRLPPDVAQTLDGYFKDAGLTGRTAKLRTAALTNQLKALARSTARGGLQPYRNSGASGGVGLQPAAGAAQGQAQGSMTAEQLAEEAEMEQQLEQMAAAFGPEALARHRAARAAAKAAAELPLPTTKSGRLKSSAKAALLAHISVHGMLGLPHEHVRAALDLPPSSSLANPARDAQLAQATPAYDASQALAYALVRLPGCYAAAQRVFRELERRLPDFQPRSLLDFGAGPGTASWAAQEVWGSSLTSLTAVEPSASMRRLGSRLEAGRRFAHPRLPLVRWQPELPPRPRQTRQRSAAGRGGRADLVVASYVLAEVASPAERAALVRQLWDHTSDMLVLLEPGTPAGAANIQDARDLLLGREGRRAAKIAARLGPEIGSSGSSSQSDANLASKAGGRRFGAHVVAPCPHDGPCPLARPGSKAWCHFGTRFQRPGFMQAAKAPRGAHAHPADHQDERYAYLVLRRGPRPADVPVVAVSRSFLDAPATRADTSSHAHAAGEHNTGVGGVADAVSHRAQQQEPLLFAAAADPEQQQQQQQEQQPPEPAGEYRAPDAAAAAAPSTGLLTGDELQQLAALLGGARSLGSTAPQAAQSSARAPTPASEQPLPAAALEHYQRINARLGVFGHGLIDGLIAMEDAGVDWASGGGPDSLSPQSAALAAGQAHTAAVADAAPFSSAGVHASNAAAAAAPAVGAQTAADELQPAFADDAAHAVQPLMPQPLSQAELDMATASSFAWSRIVRPPRKRGGHVILDVCAARCNDGQAAAAAGQLERHVVAHSDTNKWMGRAAYELAQRANWGDLWPSWYSSNKKRQVLP